MNLATGLIDVAVACFVLFELRRLGMGYPRVVVALVAFFVIDGMISLSRSDLIPGDTSASTRSTFLDVIGAALLIVLAINARRLARGIMASVMAAKYREQEYARAKRDYTQVVRHRIMNPLTVIRGATQTLEAGAADDPELRRQLLTAIRESSEVLQSITLEPERQGLEEHGVDAVPRLVHSEDGDKRG